MENFQEQVTIIEDLRDSVNEMVEERNLNKSELNQIKIEMEEFKEMWKQENAHPIENPEEFNERDFKTESTVEQEEIQDEELDENNFEKKMKFNRRRIQR